MAIRLSKDIEAILRSDPQRIVSRSPQFLSNYDNMIQNILNQMQHGSDETRKLHEKLQEHSQRITSLKRKLASANISGEAPSGERLSDSEGSLPNADITRRLANL